MNATSRLAWLLSGLLIAFQAFAGEGGGPQLAPGRYVSVGAWGVMLVKKTPSGEARFEIEAVGGNCHQCSLSGVVKGQTGVTDDAGPDETAKCKVSLKPERGGVTVESLTAETCQQYCGMRARFDGLYKLPPAACLPKQRQARRNDFLARYRAQQFAAARDALSGLLAECREFIDWVETDQLRNDLALAQYHAGDAAACLATLEKTRAGKARNAEDLGLPPCDQENYLATAKATWHNQKLCGKLGGAR